MPEFDLPEGLPSNSLSKDKFIRLLTGLKISSQAEFQKLLSQLVTQGKNSDGFVRVNANELSIDGLESPDDSLKIAGSSLSLNVATAFALLFGTANRDEIGGGEGFADIDLDKVITVINDHTRTINLAFPPANKFTLKFILNNSTDAATVNAPNSQVFALTEKTGMMMFGDSDGWIRIGGEEQS